MLCLIYLRANLRNGVSPCGRKCFWLRLLLVSWLVPPFPFKRPRQMPLGVAAIRPLRQGTPAITRPGSSGDIGARANGRSTRRINAPSRPSISRNAGIDEGRPAGRPFFQSRGFRGCPPRLVGFRGCRSPVSLRRGCPHQRRMPVSTGPTDYSFHRQPGVWISRNAIARVSLAELDC